MKVEVISKVTKNGPVACLANGDTLYIRVGNGNDCFAIYAGSTVTPSYCENIWDFRLSEAREVFYSGDVIQITF